MRPFPCATVSVAWNVQQFVRMNTELNRKVYWWHRGTQSPWKKRERERESSKHWLTDWLTDWLSGDARPNTTLTKRVTQSFHQNTAYHITFTFEPLHYGYAFLHSVLDTITSFYCHFENSTDVWRLMAIVFTALIPTQVSKAVIKSSNSRQNRYEKRLIVLKELILSLTPIFTNTSPLRHLHYSKRLLFNWHKF